MKEHFAKKLLIENHMFLGKEEQKVTSLKKDKIDKC